MTQLDRIPTPLADTLVLSDGENCDCEFSCVNDRGEEIEVVVKVKTYTEHVRSGGFQKEIEEVHWTVSNSTLSSVRTNILSIILMTF